VCVAAVQDVGSLDLSLACYATATATNYRMLCYRQCRYLSFPRGGDESSPQSGGGVGLGGGVRERSLFPDVHCLELLPIPPLAMATIGMSSIEWICCLERIVSSSGRGGGSHGRRVGMELGIGFDVISFEGSLDQT
jgi:hypothetical protein